LKLSKACFEIFGFDFLVDANYKTWLLEVNTNPCLEFSNSYLSRLIPRMINDALKLTVDVAFPERKGLNPYEKDVLSPFEVPGYENSEQLW
jgi:tubulin--tyrosine ligase/tubulin polyglutamylase TTLL9